LCFFSYLSYEYLYSLRNKFNFVSATTSEYSKYGYGLQEGVLALIYVLSRKFDSIIKDDISFEDVKNKIDSLLNLWLKFEESIMSKPLNKEFFIKRKEEKTGIEYIDRDFKKYYRGNTLKKDLDDYFQLDSL
jgi:hypothetical protein